MLQWMRRGDAKLVLRRSVNWTQALQTQASSEKLSAVVMPEAHDGSHVEATLSTTFSTGPKRKKAVLVDGHNVVYAGFNALCNRTREKDGAHIGASIEFAKFLLQMYLKFLPDHYCIFFDTPKKTFSQMREASYKTNRTPTPFQIRPQFQICQQIAQNIFNVPIIYQYGYEADELVATYTRQFHENNCDVVVISGDKDFLQLVQDPLLPTANSVEKEKCETIVFCPRTKRRYKEKQVCGRFGGIPPKLVPDLFALIGDASDNIPRIGNISTAAAVQLLLEYGSLHELLRSLDHIEDSTLRLDLKNNISQVERNHRLVKLSDSLNISMSYDQFAQQPAIQFTNWKKRLGDLLDLDAVNEVQHDTMQTFKNYGTQASLQREMEMTR